jgi:cytidine deaminase
VTRGDTAAALFAAARRSLANAYVPYCRFPVAAAIRSTSGRVYLGVNVDNRSPAHTSCAEANALGAMVAAGERLITDIVVVGGSEGDGLLCTPCGGCRQRLSEFVDAATRVHVAGPEGIRADFRFAELLP